MKTYKKKNKSQKRIKSIIKMLRRQQLQHQQRYDSSKQENKTREQRMGSCGWITTG
jgi:hypothetical protein